MPEADTITIGGIGKAHGLGGEIRLYLDRRFHGCFPCIDKVLLSTEGEQREARIESRRFHTDVFLVKFDCVADRTEAETLQGYQVLVGRKEIEEAGAVGPFPEDLIGLHVVTVDGKELGTIDDLLDYPAGDMFQVVSGTREYLIPSTPRMIVKIDIEGGRIIVDPPPGLLELNN